jgi:hypothetical protein
MLDAGWIFFSFSIKKGDPIANPQPENPGYMSDFSPVLDDCFPALNGFLMNPKTSVLHLPPSLANLFPDLLQMSCSSIL